MIFILLISRVQGVSGENETTCPSTMAWGPEARDPMQPRRLHRRKAGPGSSYMRGPSQLSTPFYSQLTFRIYAVMKGAGWRRPN